MNYDDQPYSEQLHRAFNQPRVLTPASYQAAQDRFERAEHTRRRAIDAAAQLLTDADDEHDAANDELRLHEISAGVPKPECRLVRTRGQIARDIEEFLLMRDRSKPAAAAEVELLEKLRELRCELARF